ncbi:MAG: hypothetical protein HRU35_07080 [Rickettsiaceae bacterium]|nr:hypothetical protein [Rickettsiaceae bacterium]
MAILGASGYYIEKNVSEIPRAAHQKSFYPERTEFHKDVIKHMVDCHNFLPKENYDINENYFCYKEACKNNFNI